MKHIEPSRQHVPTAEEDRVYPPPQFIIPLRDIQQVEGGKIHFEARIEPVGDPTMVVEWFLNGKLLSASKWNRARDAIRNAMKLCRILQVLVQLQFSASDS